MSTTENYKLPSGGPFNLSSEVSATVIAQLELFASQDEGADFRRSLERRTKSIKKLNTRDKRILCLIGSALVRLGQPSEAA